MLRSLFHLSVVAVNSFVLFYDQMYLVIPMPVKEMENLPLKSRSMFLTIWTLLLQTLYHFVAFWNDIGGTNEPAPKRPPIIRKIKDALFSLSFTTAIYVSLAFWTIYAIDKDLIFPEKIAKVYTPFFNHVMHTTVSIFIIIELMTSYRNYPSRKLGFSISLTFFLSYVTWFFIIYAKTGAWVYPVFEPLNWPARIVFIIVSLSIAFMFYILGEKLNDVVCSTQKKTYINGTNGMLNNKKKRT